MRNFALLATRLVIGGYLVGHGAQKAFGAFGGDGLEKTAAGFDYLGLKPAKQMAQLAAGSEIAGGALLAAGIANPVGPVLIGSAMTSAAAVHAPSGPFGQKGGYELPVTYLATAGLLAAMGPGKFKLGPALPKPLATAFAVGAFATSAYTASRILKQQKVAAQAQATQTDAPEESDASVDVTDQTVGASN